jgi:hypothetical protein
MKVKLDATPILEDFLKVGCLRAMSRTPMTWGKRSLLFTSPSRVPITPPACCFPWLITAVGNPLLEGVARARAGKLRPGSNAELPAI